MRKLLNACQEPGQHRLVRLGVFAGLRIREITQLIRENWMRESRMLRLTGKNSKRREIPVHEELEPYLDEIFDMNPHSRQPGTSTSNLDRVGRGLQLRTDVSFKSHQLRKSFATNLGNHDVPYDVIQHLLGHAGDVTRKYFKKPPMHVLRDAIERIQY